MQSRDRRLNPDLERALPADSDNDPPGYRRGRELREMLFGDGEWHPVTVRAWWRDKSGRLVVQVAWTIGGEAYGESYLADPERIREA